MGYFQIRKKTDSIGEIMIFGNKVPIIGEFVRSMETGDIIVFKCVGYSFSDFG